MFSRCFYDFLKFSENLRKCSEMFGNVRKISGRYRKCSLWFVGVEELRSWLSRSPQMDPSKLLRSSNDGKVEWNTTCCTLPVAYRRICNGNPGLWLAVFFKAWDKSLYVLSSTGEPEAIPTFVRREVVYLNTPTIPAKSLWPPSEESPPPLPLFQCCYNDVDFSFDIFLNLQNNIGQGVWG